METIYQEEWFSTITTDHLLILRFASYCRCAKDKNSKYSHVGDGFWIDKTLLYAELATRPHRVRAKDRRKKNIKNINKK